MRKKLALTAILGISALALASCSTSTATTDNSTITSATDTSVIETSTNTGTLTTEGVTTSEGVTTTEETATGYKMPEYNSTFTPQIQDKLPEIRITHESDATYPGKDATYFVTSPVSYAVKDAKKGWLSPSDPQLSVPDPYYEACTVSVKDGAGTQTLTDVTANVKVRGNWTTDYDKKPLRIKFDEKQQMLGLNGDAKAKSWVLIAGYKDWSMLRDATGLYLSKLISRNYASDFRLVDVYINNQYWGVYLLAEQQQINKNRININSVKTDYTGTDIGYLLEYDSYAQYEDENNKFTMESYGLVKDMNGVRVSKLNRDYTIKSDIYSANQTSFIKSYMDNLWDICYDAANDKGFKEFNADYTGLVASNATSALECVSKVVDIESLVDTYILQEIVCDPDIYFSSFYMDVDMSETGDKKLRFEAPWDFDSTLGNKYNTSTQNRNNSGIDFEQYAGITINDVNGNAGYGNPWMMLFASCDWFQELVKQKWTMISKSDTLSKLTSYIDTCTTKYASSFDNNFSRWTSIRNNNDVKAELCKEAMNCKTQKESAAWLKTWLTTRFTILDKYYKN